MFITKMSIGMKQKLNKNNALYKINALYLDLFECHCNSTKVLTEDTIFTSHTGLPFYMVVPAT